MRCKREVNKDTWIKNAKKEIVYNYKEKEWNKCIKKHQIKRFPNFTYSLSLGISPSNVAYNTSPL